MKNIRLLIEYDGLPFAGWQRQLEKPSIQGILEDILGQVHGTQRKIVHGASRTDSGVHALGQVAHFYTEKNYPEKAWCHLLNDSLPPEIRIVKSEEVPLEFDSQRDAVAKVYDYRILNATCANALDRRVYFFPRPLDWKRIAQALPHFIGEHDFKSFQGAKSTVLTTKRTIFNFTLHEEQGNIFRFRVEGSGFLKQMVRNMMGTLLEIGEGKRSPDSIPELIRAKDRRKAGKTLPSDGLFLVEVKYPS